MKTRNENKKCRDNNKAKPVSPVSLSRGVPAWALEGGAIEAKERQGKSAVANLPQQNTGTTRDDGGDALDECVEPPEPCGCGSLAFWWDLLGGLHCLRCEPATASRALLRRAAAIRQREAERSAAR